jgi:molecular chaperone Hsp33
VFRIDRVTDANADLDRALGFILVERHARGRFVRLGPVLETILSAHGYPPVIERLLIEALTITALLGAMLKDTGGQLTMQAQTEGGPVSLLVCDYRGGELRGYVKHDADRLAESPANPTLFGLFGKGYLAITFDQETSGERYQGIVPLEGESLAQAVESYFSQSEQIPSLVRVGVSGRVAGGLLVQHLAEGEDGRERIHTRLDHPEWEHVEILSHSIRPEELTDPAVSLETLVWRLYHDEGEVRVLGGASLSQGCRCDPNHIRDVIFRFPEEERLEMADRTGIIAVDCEFCARKFPVSLH